MSHVRARIRGSKRQQRRRGAPLALLAALLFSALFALATGCSHTGTSRAQSEEEGEQEKVKTPEVKTIGHVTTVAYADPVPVMGIGLVVGLDGTGGGGGPPGGYRANLEDYLRKRGVKEVKEILASSTTSLVLVAGLLPPGAKKGDPVDVEVTLPPQSKTTSLRGGYLKECLLYNYDSTRNLDPEYKKADRPLLGHALVKAEGHLLVGLGDGDESAKLKQGRIWGGGRSNIDRPLYLVLNEDQQFSRMAEAVAARINETFHGPFGGGFHETASAKSRSVVFLRVPAQYQHNLPRYLRVVRLIPLRESLKTLQRDNLRPAMSTEEVAVGVGSPYRKRLESELLDPADTVTAALRLEAQGQQSIPILKRGLESDHVLVRFTAAEALAYLGSPSCGEELARLVEEQPALRAFCLTALASLDEAVSHVKLRELLASPSAEARYGAFRALRALDEREPAVQGEMLSESFWLHRVTPHAPGLVHLSSSRRAEIVLFGEEPYLVPPFSLLAGEFTITAPADDDHCTLSRFSVRHGNEQRQCALKLEEVIRTMADMGAIYPDVIELLRQANACQGLTCRIAVDALPQATSIYDIARAGKDDPDFVKTDVEILNAKADFGATPNLFEKGIGRKSRSADKDAETLLKDKNGKGEQKTAELKGKPAR